MKEERIRFCGLKNVRSSTYVTASGSGCCRSADQYLFRVCGSIDRTGPGRICGFLGYDAEYIIPFECIRRIGEDIILVEIKEDKCLKPCK